MCSPGETSHKRERQVEERMQQKLQRKATSLPRIVQQCHDQTEWAPWCPDKNPHEQDRRSASQQAKGHSNQIGSHTARCRAERKPNPLLAAPTPPARAHCRRHAHTPRITRAGPISKMRDTTDTQAAARGWSRAACSLSPAKWVCSAMETARSAGADCPWARRQFPQAHRANRPQEAQDCRLKPICRGGEPACSMPARIGDR